MTGSSTISCLPLDEFHQMTSYLGPRDIDALACVDREHLGKVEACRFLYIKNLFNYMVAHQIVDRLDLDTLAQKSVESCNSYDEEIIRSVVDRVLKEVSEFCAEFPEKDMDFSNPYKIPTGAEFYEDGIISLIKLERFNYRKKQYDSLHTFVVLEPRWVSLDPYCPLTTFLVCASVQSKKLLDVIKVYSELVNLCKSTGSRNLFFKSILEHNNFNKRISVPMDSKFVRRILDWLERSSARNIGPIDKRTIMSYNEWLNLEEESNCFMSTVEELNKNIKLFCRARDNIKGLETLDKSIRSINNGDSEHKIQSLVFEELKNLGFREAYYFDCTDTTFPYLEMSEAINDIFRDPPEELKSEMEKIVILESNMDEYNDNRSFFKLDLSMSHNFGLSMSHNFGLSMSHNFGLSMSHNFGLSMSNNLHNRFMPEFYRFFPNLRELKLSAVDHLQIKRDSFPSLEFLSINRCEKIEICSDTLQKLDVRLKSCNSILISCPSLEMILEFRPSSSHPMYQELQKLGEHIGEGLELENKVRIKFTEGLFCNINLDQPSEVNEQPVDFDFENQKLLEDIKSNYGDQGLLQIDAERANIENALDVSRIKNSALVDQIQNLALQRFYNRLLLESYTIKLESDFGREALDQFHINIATQTVLRYFPDNNSGVMQLLSLAFAGDSIEALLNGAEFNHDKAKEFGISNQYNDAQIFTNSMKYILEKYKNKISNDSEIISDSE